MIAGVLAIPYIIRGIGTTEYGIYSIATMVLGYFSIFNLGLSRATVKFVAENLSPERVHKVPEIVWTSFALLVGIGSIAAVIGMLFVPISVTRFFKMPPEYIGEARTALFILCASVPLMLASDCARGILEAAQRFDLLNLVRVPASVLFYALAALVIPFGAHVVAIVIVMICIRVASTVLYLLFSLKVFPELRSNFRISRAAIRPLASFGGWVMVSNITGPIFGSLERFMIASVLSVSWLTFYSAPYDLVSKIIIFPASIVPSLFPYFSYHGARSSNEVSEVTARTVKYLLLVLSPVIAILIFFARDILQLWLGPQFASQSTAVLQISAFAFFLNAFAMVPFTSVQALGRPDLKAALDVMVLPIYAVFSWWLMRKLGIDGAAWAKAAVTILDCGALYIIAARLKAFSFRDCVSGPLFRAGLASGGLFLAIYAVKSLHLMLLASAPLVLACFVCYAAVFWVVSVDQDDRTTIGGLRDRLMSVLHRKSAPPAMQITGNDAGV